MTYGELILHHRTKHFMTRQELSELSGVSVSTITRTENGTQLPTLPVFETLCSALSIPYGLWDNVELCKQVANEKQCVEEHKQTVLHSAAILNYVEAALRAHEALASGTKNSEQIISSMSIPTVEIPESSDFDRIRNIEDILRKTRIQFGLSQDISDPKVREWRWIHDQVARYDRNLAKRVMARGLEQDMNYTLWMMAIGANLSNYFACMEVCKIPGWLLTGYFKGATYQSMYDEVVTGSHCDQNMRHTALIVLRISGDKKADNGFLWSEAMHEGKWVDAYPESHEDHICNPTCAEFVENSKNTRLWELAERNSLPPDASLIEMRQMVLDKLSEEDKIILGYIL